MGFRDLKRKKRQKERQKLICLICEGETEEKYFRSLCNCLGVQKNVDVQRVSMPKTQCELAKKWKSETPKEGIAGVFCVFDENMEEVCEGLDIPGVVRKAQKDQISTVISNPVFEIWFVLHYNKYDKACSKKDIIKHLKTIPDFKNYVKGKDYFRLLQPKMKDAKENAIWLETRQKKAGSSDKTVSKNPSTDVHKLIEKLVQFKRLIDRKSF